jgi:cytochrome c553
MTFRSALVALACGLLAGQTCAAADLEAGKEKAEVCTACHGEKGAPEMANVPAIWGQNGNFLQWQLVYFRSERRKSEFMTPIAKDLTDADVRNLGAYFASLPRPPAPTTDLADASLREAGKKAIEDHHCAACHSDTFVGINAAPAISHQHHDYLIKALSDYRANARPSQGVGAMNEAASSLTDDEIKSIAAYLETYQ